MDELCIAEELRSAGMAEGTEIGELWIALANMAYRHHFADERFSRAFLDELMRQHIAMRRGFRWIEREETTKRIVRELVPK